MASSEKWNFDYAIDTIKNIPLWISVTGLIISSICESIIFDFELLHNTVILVPVVTFFAFGLLLKISDWLESKAFSSFIAKIPTMVVYGVHMMVGILLNRFIIGTGLLQYTCRLWGMFVIACACAMMVSRINILNYVFNGNRKAR